MDDEVFDFFRDGLADLPADVVGGFGSVDFEVIAASVGKWGPTVEAVSFVPEDVGLEWGSLVHDCVSLCCEAPGGRIKGGRIKGALVV